MTQERKNPIIRREKFVVDHSEKDTKGNLVVISSSGKDYHIGIKRKHLFDYFQDGAEVVVGYASFKGEDMPKAVEYIDEVTPAQALVSADTPIQSEQSPKEKPKTVSQEIKENMKWKSDQITVNMFWRILADRIIYKDIDITTAEGKLLRAALNAKMLEVLDINIKKGGE